MTTPPWGEVYGTEADGKRVVEPGRSVLDPALASGLRLTTIAGNGCIERDLG